MKKFSEQFNKKSQTVKLNKSEQADLRDRIVSYMEYHPLPAEMKSTVVPKKVSTRQSLPLETFITYKVPFATLFKFGGAVAAILLVVIPFVAERAVPGDTLYAVKVNLNEEVRSTLTLDPYQKVEWEGVRLNRRIAEARLLVEAGLFTAEAEAEVAAAVRAHTATAKAEIATLRELDADEATIAELSLDSTLTVQSQALAQAVLSADKLATTSASTDLIATAIGESLEKPFDHASTTLPSRAKLTARVEQGTTRLRELETTLGQQVDAETVVGVTRRIEDIERAAAEAFSFSEELEVAAQEMLIDVLTRTQKLIVFMTELQVRQAVGIETVVPVVLTGDEKEVKRSEYLAQIDTYIAQQVATEIDEAELAEKLDSFTERLQAIRDELEAVVEYSAFIELSAEGIALAEEATILIEQSGVLTNAPLPTDPTATTTNAVATSSATTTDEFIVNEELDEEQISTTTLEGEEITGEDIINASSTEESL